MPVLFFFLFCLILPLQKPGTLNIYLHRTAIVAGPVFTLGEVATIVSPDPEELSRLHKLEIGPTAEGLALFPVRLIRERIETQIQGEVYIVGKRIALIPAELFTRQDIWFYEQFLEHLDKAEPDKRGRLELRILTFPHLPACSESQGGPCRRVIFKLNPAGGLRRTREHLAGEAEISYRIPGIDDYSGTFAVWIHHFLPVARAGRNLTPNQPLTRQSLYYSEQDISLSAGTHLLFRDEPEHYRVTAQICKGEPVYRSQLEKNLAVKAGDALIISFFKPGLLVTAEGKALASGAIGDTITVQPRDSRERFWGRITSAGEVKVEIQ